MAHLPHKVPTLLGASGDYLLVGPYASVSCELINDNLFLAASGIGHRSGVPLPNLI